MTTIIRENLTQSRDLLAAVESRKPDLERLRELGVVLGDMASDTRQDSIRSELAQIAEKTDSAKRNLTSRIACLESLDSHWTQMMERLDEMESLLNEKKALLQQILGDTSLTPDQQYEAVKVSQ